MNLSIANAVKRSNESLKYTFSRGRAKNLTMLRAYRLVYPFSSHAPQQLWEWQQPHVDHLVLNARTFRRRVVGWWFAD